MGKAPTKRKPIIRKGNKKAVSSEAIVQESRRLFTITVGRFGLEAAASIFRHTNEKAIAALQCRQQNGDRK